MRVDTRNARWEPWHLICAAGANANEYSCVPGVLVTNHEQQEAILHSTMTMLAIMSPMYQPPKVK